jgi:hypothetical protein
MANPLGGVPMKAKFQTILLMTLTIAPAVAEENNVYGGIGKLKLSDDVTWIDETPLRPESYIGQLYVVDKKDLPSFYFASIPLPVAVEEEPSIKKSLLVKSTKDGSVSFLDIFKISGQKESVYQFQIVNSKKWSANSASPDYLKAITTFRNDPMTTTLFDSPETASVLMVTGVVQKKIWYKVFKKEGWGGSGTYYVKVEGNDYSSSDEYEESVKYGLLLRPIHSVNHALPKHITSASQVEDVSKNTVLPKGVTDRVAMIVSNSIYSDFRRKNFYGGGATAAPAAAQAEPMDMKAMESKGVEATLVKIEGEFYMLKGKNGKEFKGHFDDKTKKVGKLKAGSIVVISIDDKGHTTEIGVRGAMEQ